jgi:hypothetical protein
MMLKMLKEFLQNQYIRASLLQTFFMVKGKLIGAMVTPTKAHSKMANIMVKVILDGAQIKSYIIKESSKEAKCMALGSSITLMEFLKENSNLASLKVKQLRLSITVTNTQENSITPK